MNQINEMKAPPISSGDVLRLRITDIGRNGDLIAMYKNYPIYLEHTRTGKFSLTNPILVKVKKTFPKYALGTIVTR